MSWVAGIDGCRGGWIAVLVEHGAGKVRDLQVELCLTFADILALDPQPAVIAIDIPIGLLDKPQPSGRECDRHARQLLGRRASSIFSPPTRPMLKATRYEQVRARGLSIQSFNIVPKIREVDRLITPDLQQRVHEAHPELAFAALAGAPMKYNKKTREGREERTTVLQQWLDPIPLPTGERIKVRGIKEKFLSPQTLTLALSLKGRGKKHATIRQQLLRSQVAPDDILDACALAWTALCISTNKAKHVPDHLQTDRKGLRMEIWFP